VRFDRVRVRPALAAVTLALGVAAVAPSIARAESCVKPDLVDMVPPDGATGVPLNARLGAHYAPTADYVDEDVVLILPDGSQLPFGKQHETDGRPASWDPTEQLMQIAPVDPLLPNSSYKVRWPALRGANAVARGLGDEAQFQTGATDDLAPPSFAGVSGVTWDLDRSTDPCSDQQIERYVFDIQLGAASDDGGTSGLTLLLAQTKGPLVMDTPTRFAGRAWPQDDGSGAPPHVQVKVSTGVGAGDVCFAGVVRDTLGALSAGGNVEACVHTTTPPFFRGCSVTGGAGARGEVLFASLALAALLVRRRSGRGA